MEKKGTKAQGWDYILILLIFAITGSTAAIVARYLMPVTGLERGWNIPYILVYILLITPIYQVLLLGYAFIFGKYTYFLEKQKKLGRWIASPFKRSPASKETE